MKEVLIILSMIDMPILWILMSMVDVVFSWMHLTTKDMMLESEEFRLSKIYLILLEKNWKKKNKLFF